MFVNVFLIKYVFWIYSVLENISDNIVAITTKEGIEFYIFEQFYSIVAITAKEGIEFYIFEQFKIEKCMLKMAN